MFMCQAWLVHSWTSMKQDCATCTCMLHVHVQCRSRSLTSKLSTSFYPFTRANVSQRVVTSLLWEVQWCLVHCNFDPEAQCASWHTLMLAGDCRTALEHKVLELPCEEYSTQQNRMEWTMIARKLNGIKTGMERNGMVCWTAIERTWNRNFLLTPTVHVQ